MFFLWAMLESLSGVDHVAVDYGDLLKLALRDDDAVVPAAAYSPNLGIEPNSRPTPMHVPSLLGTTSNPSVNSRALRRA